MPIERRYTQMLKQQCRGNVMLLPEVDTFDQLALSPGSPSHSTKKFGSMVVIAA
jgi:hypothetical protein